MNEADLWALMISCGDAMSKVAHELDRAIPKHRDAALDAAVERAVGLMRDLDAALVEASAVVW